MGVNYEASYGIGALIPRNEVQKVLADEDHDYGDDISEYVFSEALVLPDWTELITVGDSYEEEPVEYYLILSDPFCNGVQGLPALADALISYVRDLGFTCPDKIELVGGLYVS